MASLAINPSKKRGDRLLLKERICFSVSKFSFLSCSPLQREAKMKMAELLPMKVFLFLIWKYVSPSL